MVTLTGRGPRLDAGPGDLARLQAEFARSPVLRVSSWLDAALLDRVRAGVTAATFDIQRYPPFGEEACMAPNATLWMLDFLMNAPEVTRTVSHITGCGPIGCFFGRIYRLAPGTDHGHDWHRDCEDDRLIGVSVNLTDREFEGGALQLRRASNLQSTGPKVRRHALLAEVRNTGPGDAVLFRIAPDLEHRVLPVTGTVPRLAYTGWFRARPSYSRRLRGR